MSCKSKCNAFDKVAYRMPLMVEFTQETGEDNMVEVGRISRIKQNSDGKVSLKIDGEWIGVQETFDYFWMMFAPVNVMFEATMNEAVENTENSAEAVDEPQGIVG